MTKVLYEVFVTFAKGDGEELRESFVAEDSVEERQNVLEEWGGMDFDKTDVEAFISKASNWLGFDCDDPDWRSPTGGYIKVSTYAEKFEEIVTEYVNSQQLLVKQFGIEGADEDAATT